MATDIEARTQLSRDLGDLFAGTTTDVGDTTTLKDDKLLNYDDDEFVTKFTTWVELVSGADAGLSRRMSSKTGADAKVVAFPNAIGSGIDYEVHNVAIPDDKDDAITQALNLLNGVVLFKKAQAEITIVADQFDYGVPAGFYRNQIRQVHLVSAGDTEITRELYDWEPRVNSSGGDDIHFFSRLQAGQVMRIFGHQVVALSDLTDGSGNLLILSARAAMHIYQSIISVSPSEQVGRYQTLLTDMTALYNERLLRYRETGIPFSMLTQAYKGSTLDRDFSV